MYAEHDSQLFEWHPETTQYNGYAGNEQQPGGSRGNGLVDDGATYSPAISNAATDGSIYIPSIEDIQLFLEGTLTLEDLATPGPSVIGVDDLQPAFDSPIQLPPLQLHAMHDGFAPQLPSIRRYKAFGSGDADRRESRRRSAPSFDSERPSRPTWHTQPQRATTPTRFDPTAHASGSALPADLAGAAGAYAEGSSTGNGAYFSDADTGNSEWVSSILDAPIAEPSGSPTMLGSIPNHNISNTHSGTSSQSQQGSAGTTRLRPSLAISPHRAITASITCPTCGKALVGETDANSVHVKRCRKRTANATANCTLCGKLITTHRADGFHKHLMGTSRYIQCEQVTMALGGRYKERREVTPNNIGLVGTWLRTAHPQVEADGWCVPGQWAGDSKFSQWLKRWAILSAGPTAASGSRSGSGSS